MTVQKIRTAGLALALAAAMATNSSLAQPAAVDVGQGKSVQLANDRPLKIAFFSEGANNSAMQASIDGATEAAKKLGWQIDVFDGKFDPVTQLNQLQNALARDYDAWVLKAVEGNIMCDVATKDAPAKNILVVTAVLSICGRGANEGAALWSPGTLAYVGGAETPLAFFQVLDRMGKENPGPQKLGVITGPELNPITKNHEAALAMFKKKYPEVKVVAIARTDYSTPSALEKAGPMVQANPDMTLYYTAFSNLSKGLVPVLEEAGKLDKVKIYDNGATTWAVEALKDGKIAVSSANRLKSNAYNAVMAIAKAQNGEAVARAIGDLGEPLVEGQPPTNPYLIDKGNVDAFKPEVE
ncbi:MULTISPECIES: sugar ABC transporter substrate-binding protein [unclassified Mesorhizobium]|uniref:sugar ABC transporter substrate-binding protein n=1 Tax=unclassified Mesorhizobium TaxID=325217 RepID=UPI001FDEC0C6|nr:MULTISPECIES: sugar ABC transporter substrate-binding protein [unclassified Mesorhizobium]